MNAKTRPCAVLAVVIIYLEVTNVSAAVDWSLIKIEEHAFILQHPPQHHQVVAETLAIALIKEFVGVLKEHTPIMVSMDKFNVSISMSASKTCADNPHASILSVVTNVNAKEDSHINLAEVAKTSTNAFRTPAHLDVPTIEVDLHANVLPDISQVKEGIVLPNME